jgi:hypothetical protein
MRGVPGEREQGAAKWHLALRARRLSRKDDASNGFTRLSERKRLDLSVEAHVLQPEYAPLFTEEQRRIARARLREYGYAG